MYSLARPFLFHLDAERAHDVGLRAIEAAYRTGMSPLLAGRPKPLPTKAFGLVFPNPVGCAAGLDKDGAHVDALLALHIGIHANSGELVVNPTEFLCSTKFDVEFLGRAAHAGLEPNAGSNALAAACTATTAMPIIVQPMGSVPISVRLSTSSRTPAAKISSRIPEARAARIFQIRARPTARKLMR